MSTTGETRLSQSTERGRILPRRSLAVRWLAALTLVSALGCSSSDGTRSYSTVASPLTGGVVAIPNGATITIPAGAVTQDVTIVATPQPTRRAPAGSAVVGTPVQLGPAGTTFGKAIEISMPIEPSGLPAGSTLDDVVVLRADQGSTVFVPLPTRRSGSAHVVAITEHFSDFVPVVFVGARPACGDRTCAAGEACSDCPGDCGLCLPAGECGDGTCGSAETCGNCAFDCGACSADPIQAWVDQTKKLISDRVVACRADESYRPRLQAEADAFFRSEFAPERFAAGARAFDAARAQECLDVLTLWPPCGIDLDVVLSMCVRQVAHGTLAQGGGCSSSYDCAEGLACVSPQDADPCTGICMPGPKGAPGTACHDVSDCAPATTPGDLTTCDLGPGGFRICGVVGPMAPLAPGATCAVPTDDRAGPVPAACPAGHDCVVASGTATSGTCQAMLTPGMPCAVVQGASDPCQRDVATCRATDATASAFLCYATIYDVPLSGSCDLDPTTVIGRGVRECDRRANLTCDASSTCVAAGDGALGAKCAGDADCLGGAPCIDGSCVQLLADGAPCSPQTPGEFCLSGACHGELLQCVSGPEYLDPGGAEVCDGSDNDCDGAVDEGFSQSTWYVDADYDGYYGMAEAPLLACGAYPGIADLPGDCAPNDPNVSPAASEVPYNGVDDDCNATTEDTLCGNLVCDTQAPYAEDAISCPGDCP